MIEGSTAPRLILVLRHPLEIGFGATSRPALPVPGISVGVAGFVGGVRVEVLDPLGRMFRGVMSPFSSNFRWRGAAGSDRSKNSSLAGASSRQRQADARQLLRTPLAVADSAIVADVAQTFPRRCRRAARSGRFRRRRSHDERWTSPFRLSLLGVTR
jgi:hypothetical protein